MNELLISKKHEVFTYRLKEGTNSSYYLSVGERNILPERIGYSEGGFMPIQNKGRALIEKKQGQISGSFRIDETSPYKLNKPYRLFSTVWAVIRHPELLGYGDIGISNRDGKIESSNDLFILIQPARGIMEVHLFKALLLDKDNVVEYMIGYIKKQALKRAC